MVSTWDIEQGVRVSSFTGLTPGQKYNIGRISAMSSNGQLIAIPGRQHLDLFRTATWTLVGTDDFDSVELTEAIGDVHFIRNDTQIVVGVGVGVGSDSEEVPFHRKNKGYIINTETVTVVGRFVSQASDVFLFKMGDSWTSPQVYCIGSSQVSSFDLQDRIIHSPTKLGDFCDASCMLVSSFKNSTGRKEVVLPVAGMTFRAEAIMKPIVVNGCRETLPFVAAEARGSNGLLIQRMSIPFPREAVFRSARLVGGKDGCSYLLVVLDKCIMVWSTPKSARGRFVLRLVQDSESDTMWKICPHSQLYARKASDDKTTASVTTAAANRTRTTT